MSNYEQVPFSQFKGAVQKQFNKMKETGLFVVDLDKDYLWDFYLDSFPEGTNNIYRERREYDCNCCKQFIKAVGGLVTVKDNTLVSIWDIQVGGYYQIVADKLSELTKASVIKDHFLYFQKTVGTDRNFADEGGNVKEWEHFYLSLPNQYVVTNGTIATQLGDKRSNKEVLMRSLEELSSGSAEIVLELIEQGSLYRGEEHKRTVQTLIKLKRQYDKLEASEKDNFCWVTSAEMGGASKIRNTVIGTLLQDLSEGKELDAAVTSFEVKVAPTNYKRPKALVTKGMIEQAQKQVKELGIDASLPRRYAVAGDVTINNVIFADRSTKPLMDGGVDDVFGEMLQEIPDNITNLDKVEEVSIQEFIQNIVPKAQSIEMMVENKHTNNFMSLIAPVNPSAPNILKWGNNFSWAYNGEVTDSMKERVKAAGGSVSGDLRFSIQWNGDGQENLSDLDAHCYCPDGKTIYFSEPYHRSGGNLDIDIQYPQGVAVENITFPSRIDMKNGTYVFYVHQYAKRGGRDGFQAQIEFDGQIFEYEFPTNPVDDSKTHVAEVTLKNGQFSIDHKMESTVSSKEVWGINTQKFQKVNMIMNSPNHWDGEETGNKHWFFILEGCKNDDKARGFFNEYLREDLTKHRKVFEVLGSKMKAPESEEQLSGLGFSSTQRNQVVFKVVGSFSRMIKVNF